MGFSGCLRTARPTRSLAARLGGSLAPALLCFQIASDGLEDLLRMVGQTDLSDEGAPLEKMDAGLVVPVRRWGDYLTLSVTEIREYGHGSIQVVRRLRAMLDELSESVLPERREAVLHELERLDDAVAARWGASVDVDLAGRSDRQGIGGPTGRAE